MNFVGSKWHEPLDQEHGFFAVTVRKLVVYCVNRHLFPLAAVVFAVAELGLVKTGLAQIVQERNDGVAFQIVGLGIEMLGDQHVVHVERVVEQTALIRSMEPRGRGSREEIRALKPRKQLFRARTMDVFVVGFDENLFI